MFFYIMCWFGLVSYRCALTSLAGTECKVQPFNQYLTSHLCLRMSNAMLQSEQDEQQGDGHAD